MSDFTTDFIDSDGLECVISEMANDPASAAAGVVIQIDPAKVAQIKARDENPQFVTVAIESGVSRSKRLWTGAMLKNIAEQVNKKKPVGYKGHMKAENISTEFPEPQTVWLGATTVTQGDKTVLWIKGYNLPTSHVRGWLENEAVNSVSVFGESKMKAIKGGYEVVDFNLESIDWSRKGQSGMTARVMAVTSEMDSSKGGLTVEPKEITALSEDEVRTHAPLLVAEIERKAKAPLDTQIGEMTTTVAELEPQVDMLARVRELLGLAEGENVIEKVTNLLAQIEDASASEIKAYITQAIGKKVKTERGQALVARLVGEMHTEYDGELDDEMKTKIDTDLEEKIEADEILKSVVGEMIDFTDEKDKKGGGQGGSALGGRSKQRDVSGADKEKGIVSRNSQLTVRKRTLA